MLDVLLKIKNNNMSKLPQYDPSHSEHLKKIIKTMIRKGNYVTELKISLEDLLNGKHIYKINLSFLYRLFIKSVCALKMYIFVYSDGRKYL